VKIYIFVFIISCFAHPALSLGFSISHRLLHYFYQKPSRSTGAVFLCAVFLLLVSIEICEDEAGIHHFVCGEEKLHSSRKKDDKSFVSINNSYIFAISK